MATASTEPSWQPLFERVNVGQNVLDLLVKAFQQIASAAEFCKAFCL